MIKLPRGNTLDLSVMLYDAGGAPYALKEKDSAVFTVKLRDDMSENPIIRNTYSHRNAAKTANC